jgi:DNA polymerase III alpha subunit
MNTTEETPKSAELAIVKGYVEGEVDFDSLFDQDSKEIAKKREKSDKKEGKRIQLLAQINGVKLKKQKLKGMYVLSLTDPTTDSVSILMQMKSLEEEQQAAIEIFSFLFPNEKELVLALK